MATQDPSALESFGTPDGINNNTNAQGGVSQQIDATGTPADGQPMANGTTSIEPMGGAPAPEMGNINQALEASEVVNPVDDSSQTEFFSEPANGANSVPINSIPNTVVQNQQSPVIQPSPAPSQGASLGKKIIIFSVIIILIIVLLLAGLVVGTEYGLLKFGFEKIYLKTGIQALWGGLPYDAKGALAISAKNMSLSESYHYDGNLTVTFNPGGSLLSQDVSNTLLSEVAKNKEVGFLTGFVKAGQDLTVGSSSFSSTKTEATSKAAVPEEADLKIAVKGDKSGDDHQLTFNISNSLNESQTIITAIISNNAIYFQQVKENEEKLSTKSLINLTASTSATSSIFPPQSASSTSSDQASSSTSTVNSGSATTSTTTNNSASTSASASDLPASTSATGTGSSATTDPTKTSTSASAATNKDSESTTASWLALNVTDVGGLKTNEIDLTNLANSVASSEFLGYEVLGGKLNGHYQINIDAQKLIEALGLIKLDMTKLDRTLVKLDIWMNKKEKLLSKVNASFGGEVASSKLNTTLTMTYSGFGQAKAITKPTATDVLATTLNDSWNMVTGNVKKEEVRDLTTPEGRDKARKSDLLIIKTALDAYYKDQLVYPVSTVTDKTSSPESLLAKALVTKYLEKLPTDPSNSTYYYGYKSEDGKSFELSAVLEDSTDQDGEKVGNLNIYKIKSDKTINTPTNTTSQSPSL